MNDNTFDRDLNAGERVEYFVLNEIHQKYPNAYKQEGYFKEYDIHIPEVDITIEVKQDYKSNFTGNFVVEVEFRGKPSALSTTKADYWIFASRDKLYWIKVKKVIEAIQNNNLKLVEFIGNGDYNPKKAYLVPVSIIEKYSDKISENELPYTPQSPS